MLFQLQKLRVIERENKCVHFSIKAAVETSAVFPTKYCAKGQQINTIYFCVEYYSTLSDAAGNLDSAGRVVKIRVQIRNDLELTAA